MKQGYLRSEKKRKEGRVEMKYGMRYVEKGGWGVGEGELGN